jgi:hypothetical protein
MIFRDEHRDSIPTKLPETMNNYPGAQFRCDFDAGVNVLIMGFPLPFAFLSDAWFGELPHTTHD